MQVQQIMTQPAITCRSYESLQCAASLMWKHDIGAIPVLNDVGTVVGMITDRDIAMAALFEGRPIQDIPIFHSMCRTPISCSPGDRLRDAEKKMRNFQVRRLPVVAADGRVVGVLSLNDIAVEAARESSHNMPEVKPNEVARTLAAICTPRTPQELRTAV